SVGALSLVGNGVAVENSSTLTIQGPVTVLPGAGQAAIGTSVPGAEIIDNAPVDPGMLYYTAGGGTIELTAAPASGSILRFSPSAPGGTFALFHPGATISATLDQLGSSDVLELPGTAVTNVTFGTS